MRFHFTSVLVLACMVTFNMAQSYRKQVQQPISLGIAVSSSTSDIRDQAVIALNAAFNTFPDQKILDDLNNIIEHFQEKGSFSTDTKPHITCAFLNERSPTGPNYEIAYKFHESVETLVTIPVIAYLPGKLVAGLAYLSNKNIMWSDQILHFNMLNKGMSGAYYAEQLDTTANNFLNYLYQEVAEFQWAYDAGFTASAPISRFIAKVDGKFHYAYIIKLAEPWVISGSTTRFWPQTY